MDQKLFVKAIKEYCAYGKWYAVELLLFRPRQIIHRWYSGVYSQIEIKAWIDFLKNVRISLC